MSESSMSQVELITYVFKLQLALKRSRCTIFSKNRCTSQTDIYEDVAQRFVQKKNTCLHLAFGL